MAGSSAGVGGHSCRAIEWSLAHTRWRSSARKMYLTQLRLVNLRNHRRTELQLAQGVNVFVGANAQGKSTVLEAVELAATGRSPRATRETELITWGESWARVHVTSRRAERDEEVDLAFRQAVAAGRIYRELSGGREELAVTYAANLSGADEAELVRTAKAAMAAQRQAERARGRTLVGPHRDEITLEVDRRLLRLYGSRGQQVAAALALRLAERELLREETGEDPVLLLDDVMMTLDERRQGQLIAFARGAQVLITVTTLAALAALPAEAAVFPVTGGTVEAQRAHLA